jgi:hypothetical protein
MLAGLECTYVHYFTLPIVIKAKSLVSYNIEIDSGCVDPNILVLKFGQNFIDLLPW